MKKIFIGALTLILTSLNAFSQNTGSETELFKPNGKPLVTIYSDARYNIQDGKTNPAFELSRAYFGYVYNFSPNFSSKVVFDVSNTAGLSPSSFTAYVKNAFGEYANKFIKVDFGMIGTSAFNLQESTWGKRYLLKSFQDLNGYSSSADLGVSAKLQLTPQLSVDAQILNGEGYQKVQADSTVKVALGLTYEPVKNLFVRVYGDYMKKNVAQKTFNAFVSYVGKDFTLAGEYNIQKGNKMVSDHDLTGLSFWGTYKASKVMSIFGRFDNLTSNTLAGATSNWNASKDGQLYAAGLEFFPVKGVIISPNVQYSDPKLATAKSATSLLMNVSLSF
jgi:hypothetical protein